MKTPHEVKPVRWLVLGILQQLYSIKSPCHEIKSFQKQAELLWKIRSGMIYELM